MNVDGPTEGHRREPNRRETMLHERLLGTTQETGAPDNSHVVAAFASILRERIGRGMQRSEDRAGRYRPLRRRTEAAARGATEADP